MPCHFALLFRVCFSLPVVSQMSAPKAAETKAVSKETKERDVRRAGYAFRLFCFFLSCLNFRLCS